jgi:hypothetical protein
MNNREAVARLTVLAQLEVDAMLAYDTALGNVSEGRVRALLLGWRAEHEGRLMALAALIRNHGGTPPEYSCDFSGYLIPGMTEVQPGVVLRTTLVALLRNEWLSHKTYEEAAAHAWPRRAFEVVRLHRLAALRMVEEMEVAFERHGRDTVADRAASGAMGP